MRIIVVGTSGAGKTTMAKSIASMLNLPCIELDRLHWGPNWEAMTETNPDEFVRRVSAAISARAWGQRWELRCRARFDLAACDASGLAGLRSYSRYVSRHQTLNCPSVRSRGAVGWEQRGLAPLGATKPSNQMGLEYVERTAITVRASPE
jgi:ATPase family associated with various cellular activities (AAA)